MASAPVRVCLVAPVPPPYGGISHWVKMIHAYAEKSIGVTISIINTAPRGRSIYQKKLLRRVAVGIIGYILISIKLANELIRRRVDLVHITTSGRLAVFRDLGIVLLCKFFGVPVVYHIHFGRIPEIAGGGTLEWRIISLVVSFVRVVVAIDKATEEAVKIYLPNINIQLIPNCIDIQKLPSSLRGKGSARTAIFIGWIVPTKGIEELMAAWSDLKPEGWRLKIIGPGDPQYLRQLLKRYESTNVDFLGELPHDEAMAMLAVSDLFILPSYSEGFPNAVLEAMALGTAIVATEVGAVDEMLSGGCGILIKPRDIPSLKSAIRMTCSNSDLRTAMGERARVRAKEKYSLDVIFSIYFRLWCQLRK